MKFFLHEGLHCEQHIAIDIIQQVKRGKNKQRSAGVKLRFGHRSSEYSIGVQNAAPTSILTMVVIND